MQWTADRDKFRPGNSTPKMSFLRVLAWVMQNVLRLWQKVATNPSKKHCTRQLTSRNRNQKRSSLARRWFCFWQWIQACEVRHSLAMTHVWHYKFNIATKTAQICDQPKECEESGRKWLYMFGSRATKLATAPWRIGRLSVLRTQKGHVCTIEWNHAKLMKSNQVI